MLKHHVKAKHLNKKKNGIVIEKEEGIKVYYKKRLDN